MAWREYFINSIPREQISKIYKSSLDDGTEQLQIITTTGYWIIASLRPKFGFTFTLNNPKGQSEIRVVKGTMYVFNAFQIKEELKKRGFKWNRGLKAWYLDVSSVETKELIDKIIEIMKLKGVL